MKVYLEVIGSKYAFGMDGIESELKRLLIEEYKHELSTFQDADIRLFVDPMNEQNARWVRCLDKRSFAISFKYSKSVAAVGETQSSDNKWGGGGNLTNYLPDEIRNDRSGRWAERVTVALFEQYLRKS